MAVIDFEDDANLSVFVNENAARAEIVFSLQAQVSTQMAQAIISRFEDSGADAKTIINTLRTDFDQGGPVFNGLRSQFKSSIRSGGDYVADKVARDTGMMIDGGEEPELELQMWQSVLDKNTCQTCAAKHGEVNTVSGWSGNGPRQTFTECGDNCRCELVPVSVVRKSMNARNNAEVIADAKKDSRQWEKQVKDKTSPIYRQKRTETRQDKDQSAVYNIFAKSLNADRKANNVPLFNDDIKKI